MNSSCSSQFGFFFLMSCQFTFYDEIENAETIFWSQPIAFVISSRSNEINKYIFPAVAMFVKSAAYKP